jgi:hypothetical protein
LNSHVTNELFLIVVDPQYFTFKAFDRLVVIV